MGPYRTAGKVEVRTQGNLINFSQNVNSLKAKISAKLGYLNSLSDTNYATDAEELLKEVIEMQKQLNTVTQYLSKLAHYCQTRMN